MVACGTAELGRHAGDLFLCEGSRGLRPFPVLLITKILSLLSSPMPIWERCTERKSWNLLERDCLQAALSVCCVTGAARRGRRRWWMVGRWGSTRGGALRVCIWILKMPSCSMICSWIKSRYPDLRCWWWSSGLRRWHDPRSPPSLSFSLPASLWMGT